MQARNARIGLRLFAVYLVFYAGFVLLNAFRPETMRSTPIEHVNLATVYGFGLIVAAFVLAILYGFLCKSDSTTEDEVQG